MHNIELAGMQYKAMSFFGAFKRPSLRSPSKEAPSTTSKSKPTTTSPTQSATVAPVSPGPGSTALVLSDEQSDNSLLERYKNYLLHCQAQICQVLEKFTNKDNYPLLICCNTGKDRTGVIIALLLSVLGVSNNSIVEDYHASQNRIDDVIQYHISKKGSIDNVGEVNAPKEVMVGLLWWVEKKYGSVQAFLCTIGFSSVKQDLVRQCLLEKEV